ncbi:ParB/RepB/Spo0J family partition protein [Streptococcus massiliensis]|uniref:Chromosome segregation protein n=1 Tax=Streptococcus massiliensis TaxID=313439 RepID=A0A380KX06_9STRE|nr:ParB/RepB/Spo0J family partition protein [Streptococcus massiliensis]SUN76298.1 chromosome segregation protein [Streptococcus massiliensis]
MEKLYHLPIQSIYPNPYQPRTNFSNEKLTELAASIKENGLIQPIIVRKSSVVGYELIAGERRLRACKLAGLSEIPAIIKSLSDSQMRYQAIIENLQREDLNPIEEAQSYQDLINRGMKHEEIAQIMGKSRPYISNSVRLLQLSSGLIEALKNGSLSSGHARLLSKYSEQEQEAWLKRILAEEISVRKLEKLLQAKSKKSTTKNNLFLQEEEKKLEKYLGTRVSIKMINKQSGKIQIHFSNEEEYQRIINSLK